jgi:hypothetical protein
MKEKTLTGIYYTSPERKNYGEIRVAKNSHLTGVSTFASRTSPSTDQSLQKSLQSRPKRKKLN